MVVDTNGLPYKKGNIDSGFWDSLLALCRLKEIKPALSEVVVDESVNIMREAAETLVEQFVSAHAGLKRFMDLAPIYAPDADDIANNYEAMLRGRFEVLALDGDHAREALRREARRIPPAGGGEGGRDTAIWLTIVALIQDGHEVHFVTNNSDDFGKGALLPELLAEIAGSEHLIHYHVDANAFLDSIAQRMTPPSIDDDDVKASFDDSLRSALIERMGGDDNDRWWETLTGDYELTNVRFGHAYDLDDKGLVRTSATFEFGALGGTYTGWLGFDANSGTPYISEIDDLANMAVG